MSRLAFDYMAPSKLGKNMHDHTTTAVISLAHSAVTYWSSFAIHKLLRLEKYEIITEVWDIYLYLLCENI